MRLKWKCEKNGKCERLTHFTLSLCQLWYCMIKISSHFNPPNFSQIFAKFRSKMKILTFSWPKWSKGVDKIRKHSQNKFLEKIVKISKKLWFFQISRKFFKDPTDERQNDSARKWWVTWFGLVIQWKLCWNCFKCPFLS